MKFDCTDCKYYTSYGPSMDCPYPEIYCSKHFYDFHIPPEYMDDDFMKTCEDFEISRYAQNRIERNRTKKLERILTDINEDDII